jgi:hypothetical protein
MEWTEITKDLNTQELFNIALHNKEVKIGENPWLIVKVGKRRFMKLVFDNIVYQGEDS